MLPPDSVAALREYAQMITEPVIDFLLKDIVRRTSQAAQLTSTAAYQVWRTQNLGMSQNEIKKELERLLGVSADDIEELLRQSAKVGYEFDLNSLPIKDAIPFEQNYSLQQIVNSAVSLAREDFSNITQTLGMVAPDGQTLPLKSAYERITDFAFEQVITGAADYNTAVTRATAKLADSGIRVIDYQSGVHRSIEAVTRGCVMGAAGLMQEDISRLNHDAIGADGWEISAHAASAPDHEPIQGRQYSDTEYERLNGSLMRRIGTLNCGHAAFPVILGVSQPQYSDEELMQMRRDNAKGVTYDGRHYSMYEATQQQRKIERTVRREKNCILMSEEQDNAEQMQIHQIRLRRLQTEYGEFSRACRLPTQYERLQKAGFDWERANRTNKAANDYYKEWSKSIGLNNFATTLDKYYDIKYTDSPTMKLIKRYADGVQNGWISPNVGFERYKALYDKIENDIVGKKTVNGITITGQSEHFLQRVCGTMVDPEKFKNEHRIIRRSGVEIEDVIDAVLNGKPSKIRINVKTGKPSQKFKSNKCKVSVNPDSGVLIQCNLGSGK